MRREVRAPPTAGSGLGWKTYVMLALSALALYLPGQRRLPPVDRDESRYAQATSQMLATRNFLDVRFQDQPRYLQPAGIYWLQSLSVSALSSPGARQIWAYRAPSLIAATAAVLLTAWIGAMLFGPQAGVVAAVLLGVSALLGFEARMAKIDATLVATVLLAQATLLRAYLGRSRGAGRLNAAVFWAALGCGLMLKGPIILIVSGTTALGVCAADRRVAWLKRLHAGWGVLVMLAVAAPWFIAIGVKTHGAFFKKAVGQNLLGKIGRGEQAHGAPPGYYLALFSLTFWPGSLAAVFALPWAWRRRTSPQIRFLLSWILPTWLMYEAIATKLPHYALPLYPAVACLAAGAATAADGWRAGRIGKGLAFAYAALWLAVGGVLCGGGAYLIWRYDGRIDPVAVGGGLLGFAAAAATLVLLRLDRRAWALGSASVAAFLVAVLTFAYALPSVPTFWISPRIAALVQRTRPCPNSVMASSAFSEPSLVFLVGRDTQLTDAPASADFLSSHRACGLALIEVRQRPAFLAEAGRDGFQPQPLGRVTGLNYSEGRKLDLTLFRAAPPASPSSPPAAPPGA